MNTSLVVEKHVLNECMHCVCAKLIIHVYKIFNLHTYVYSKHLKTKINMYKRYLGKGV